MDGKVTESHTAIDESMLTIMFMRKDHSPCSETVLIPDLQISETLPLNKLKAISLPAMSPGEYAFHCQMQMYRGQITVQASQ
ncbi:MAG: cupredoxin domain-containing protein [Gammaproteobacteria bacterium]